MPDEETQERQDQVDALMRKGCAVVSFWAILFMGIGFLLGWLLT